MRKRKSLDTIVSRLNVEGIIEERKRNQKITEGKTFLEDVINPALLQSKPIEVVHINEKDPIKVKHRVVIRRSKKSEGSSLVCELCHHLAFKLFATAIQTTEDGKRASQWRRAQTEIMQICRKCKAEHKGNTLKMKQDHKRVPRPYFDNQDLYGRTSNRSSSAWHFLRRDMVIQKAKQLDGSYVDHHQHDYLTDSESSSSSGDEADEIESDNEKSNLLRLQLERENKLRLLATQALLPATIRQKIPKPENIEEVEVVCDQADSFSLPLDESVENIDIERDECEDENTVLQIQQDDSPEPSITCVNVADVPNITEKLKFDPGFSSVDPKMLRTIRTSSPNMKENKGIDDNGNSCSNLSDLDKLLNKALAGNDIPIELSSSIHPLISDNTLNIPVPPVHRLNSSSDASEVCTPEDQCDSKDTSCSDDLFHNGTLEQELLGSKDYDLHNSSSGKKAGFVKKFDIDNPPNIQDPVKSLHPVMDSHLVVEEVIDELLTNVVMHENGMSLFEFDGSNANCQEIEDLLLKEIESEIEIVKIPGSFTDLENKYLSPISTVSEDELEFDLLDSLSPEASYHELCKSEILDREQLQKERQILKRVSSAPHYKGLCRVVTVLNQRGSCFVNKTSYSQLFDTDGMCWKLSDLPSWIGFKSNKSRNSKSLIEFGLSRRSRKVMDSHLGQPVSPQKRLSPKVVRSKKKFARKVRYIPEPPVKTFTNSEMEVADSVDSTDDSSRPSSPAILTKPVKVTIDDSLPLIDLQRKLKENSEKPQFVKFNIMKKRREERNEAFKAEMEREHADAEAAQEIIDAVKAKKQNGFPCESCGRHMLKSYSVVNRLRAPSHLKRYFSNDKEQLRFCRTCCPYVKTKHVEETKKKKKTIATIWAGKKRKRRHGETKFANSDSDESVQQKQERDNDLDDVPYPDPVSAYKRKQMDSSDSFESSTAKKAKKLSSSGSTEPTVSVKRVNAIVSRVKNYQREKLANLEIASNPQSKFQKGISSQNKSPSSLNPQAKSEITSSNSKGQFATSKSNITNSISSSGSLQTVSGVQKATVTQEKNSLPKVNLKVIQNVAANQLKQLQEKTGTKYVIVQTSNQGKEMVLKNASQASSKAELNMEDGEVDLTCHDEESFLKSTSNNILINGQRYKIDREIKLNDLVKENEKANTVTPFSAAHRDLIAQLPSILKKTIGNRTGTPTKYKIVNVIQTSRPLATANQVMTSSFNSQVITTSLNFSAPSSMSNSTIATTSHALFKNVTSVDPASSNPKRQSIQGKVSTVSYASLPRSTATNSAAMSLKSISTSKISAENSANSSNKVGNINVISITNNDLFNRQTSPIKTMNNSVISPNSSPAQYRLQSPASTSLNTPLTLNISNKPISANTSATNQLGSMTSQGNNKPIYIQTNSRNISSQSISNTSLAKATQAVASDLQLAFKLGSRPVYAKINPSTWTQALNSLAPTSTVLTKASNLVPKSTGLTSRVTTSVSSSNPRVQIQKPNQNNTTVTKRPQPSISVVRTPVVSSKMTVPNSPSHSTSTKPMAKSPLPGATNLTIRPVTINNMSTMRSISPSNATLARGAILPARAIVPSNTMMTQRNRSQQGGSNNSTPTVGPNMPRLQVIHKVNPL